MTDTPPPCVPSLLEQYQMLVNQLQHEDNLANIRAQWALVVQGLLATGAAALVGPDDWAQSPTAAWVVKALALAVLGMSTAAGAAWGLRASENQQLRLCQWWNGKLSRQEEPAYPPLHDHLKRGKRWRTSNYFWLACLVWAGLAGGTVGVAVCALP